MFMRYTVVVIPFLYDNITLFRKSGRSDNETRLFIASCGFRSSTRPTIYYDNSSIRVCTHLHKNNVEINLDVIHDEIFSI